MSISLDEVRDRVRDKLNECIISTPEIDKAILGADRSQLEAVHGAAANSNSQILLTLPSIPDGADSWELYSTSHRREPRPLFTWWLNGLTINYHPWLTDLRAMQQMLEGLIRIPHEPKYSGNARQRRNQRRKDESVETRNTYRCSDCITALKRRREYQKAKLLSKET